jgi:hypothetical protein
MLGLQIPNHSEPMKLFAATLFFFSPLNPLASPSLGCELKQLKKPWAGNLGATTLQL